MSEEDLEVLITLDDPGEDTLEEDTFDHSLVGNTVAYRSGQPVPRKRSGQRTEVIDTDPS